MKRDLIIVESPTKAKTISRFLGKNFVIESSFGHVRDLPRSKMGVDTEHDFEPTYVIPRDSQKTITRLRQLSQSAPTIYFATDEDREGEAIAWHLLEAFKKNAPGSKKTGTADALRAKVKRIVFHEITKEAILEALQNPRDIDYHLVDAQQARRILDRLVGYELSPFLWKKVAKGLSAGRVQSVALRLIVEREREIEAFKPDEYWTIEAEFTKPGQSDQAISAKLFKVAGKSLDKLAIGNEAAATKIMDTLRDTAYSVAEVNQRETKRSPVPPFTTSTLQQDANHKLGFSARQTMYLAQQLYEGVDTGGGRVGLITYMRTDSLNLADKFLNEARDFLKKTLGDRYVPESPRRYKAKSRLAQEAHEAIRPTEASQTPDSLQQYLDPRQFKLYQLIWQRAMASQMPDARLQNTAIDINDATNTYTFRATGTTVIFDGFMKYYSGTKETLLPTVTQGEAVDAKKVEPIQHFTEPPARYSEAGIVKALEEHGIGRPSTYAPTIATIVERNYVEKVEKRLKPTEIGTLVNDVLVEHFPNIVEYKFTAQMEDDLDEIANGKKEWRPVIKEFYAPFKENLDKKTEEVDKKALTESATDEVCEKCGKPMVIKIGRFGKFLACSGYPECKHTINLDRQGNKAPKPEPKVLGTDPASGLPITLKTGRFGTYIQLGEKKEKGDKVKSASLLAGMDAATLTLDQALQLLSLPRTVGKSETGEDIMAANGRFGPYIKAGTETRSLPDGASPLTITEAEARELLAQPKKASRRSGGRTLKEIGNHPESGKVIKVLEGRYGPYVTDGETHASIPKGDDPQAVTLEQAVELIAERASQPKKSKGRKRK